MAAAPLARIGAAALLLLLGPGCHSGPEACRPEGYPREFGQRAERLASSMAALPDWWSDELDERGKQHAQWWDRKTTRLGQELETTAREGYPNFVADARQHAPSLGQTVGSWWDHLVDDTRCVLDRVWYDLLILD